MCPLRDVFVHASGPPDPRGHGAPEAEEVPLPPVRVQVRHEAVPEDPHTDSARAEAKLQQVQGENGSKEERDRIVDIPAYEDRK